MYPTYTLEEIAEVLNVHITTLREYVKTGRLKAIKIGNKYIVSEENYKNFVDGKNDVTNDEE